MTVFSFFFLISLYPYSFLPFHCNIAYLCLLSSLDKSYKNSIWFLSPRGDSCTWISLWYRYFSVSWFVLLLLLSLPTFLCTIQFLFVLPNMDPQLSPSEAFSSNTNIEGYKVHWKTHAMFYHSIAGNFHSTVISSFFHELFNSVCVF